MPRQLALTTKIPAREPGAVGAVRTCCARVAAVAFHCHQRLTNFSATAASSTASPSAVCRSSVTLPLIAWRTMVIWSSEYSERVPHEVQRWERPMELNIKTRL